MKKTLVALGLVSMLGCTESASEKPEALNDKNALVLEIQNLEKSLFDASMNLQKAKAGELVALYKGYATNNPQSDTAAMYLLKAAELQMGLEEYKAADISLERLLKNYPAFDRAPQAAYMRAFIYDEHLDQKGRAKELYEAMIEAYPRHPLSNDARASIRLLGMSEEEILKMLEEKNKANS